MLEFQKGTESLTDGKGICLNITSVRQEVKQIIYYADKLIE